MVHLLSERDALITNSFSELDTPLLVLLAHGLILEQGPNALRIQYWYHLISIKKGLVHRWALRIARSALVK
jgi:hypothetical protein